MSTQLDNLERLRQKLESNMATLKKSLHYWQTWEYEYEGLKEELERPAEEPNIDEMLAIGADLGLEVVDEQEVKALLNYGRRPLRTRSQVLSQIRGRIETGQKNATTVRKQLTVTEEKLEKLIVVAEPGTEAEDGEQLVDIFEELDEEGNVLSGRVVNASKDRDKIRDVLKEKGLSNLSGREEQSSAAGGNKDRPLHQHETTSTSAKARTVAFAHNPRTIDVPRAPPLNKMHPSQRMLVLDKDDNVIDAKPLELIHPTSSASAEDEVVTIAHLREARASAQEIAPIVASFNIDAASDSEMDTDMAETDSEWSENEYGMGDIGAELTEDYKAEMEALMQKHAVAMENAGPTFDPDIVQKLETAHRDAGLVAKVNRPAEPKKSKKGVAKGVHFAEDLYVSPVLGNGGARKAADAKPLDEEGGEEIGNPVSEMVLERSSPAATTESGPLAPRKPSRFKTTMNTATNRVPDGDLQSESSTPSTTGVIPRVVPQEETQVPERPKKVSRFKAAKEGL